MGNQTKYELQKLYLEWGGKTRIWANQKASIEVTGLVESDEGIEKGIIERVFIP